MTNHTTDRPHNPFLHSVPSPRMEVVSEGVLKTRCNAKMKMVRNSCKDVRLVLPNHGDHVWCANDLRELARCLNEVAYVLEGKP